MPCSRCAECASALVQPGPFVPRAGVVTVRRRCPECGWCDWADIRVDEAAAWKRREEEIRLRLLEIADRLEQADAVILEP